MSISTHLCVPRLWTQTHFGGTVLGNAWRSRRVVRLAAGYAGQGHEPVRTVALAGGRRLARPGPQPGSHTVRPAAAGPVGLAVSRPSARTGSRNRLTHGGSRLRQGRVRESALWN